MCILRFQFTAWRDGMLNKRASGVLLHPTSLPGPGGIGSFGEDARRFIDLLASMGMSYWQVLPLTPPACGNSPYSAYSAFAGNPLLIDLQQIAAEGDLSLDCCDVGLCDNRVDFEAVAEFKLGRLKEAGAAFLKHVPTARTQEFWHFCDTTPWLHDFALFMAIKKHFMGKPWHRWSKGLALLTLETFEKASVDLGPEIGIQKYIQWQFFRQWRALRKHAESRGIAIIGDLPIFVAYDSAEVWSRRDLFLLDDKGKPTCVAGVPPDYFSKTGQLWGNPLYDWDAVKREGYVWWIKRFRTMFDLFDIVRIDHFRGFEAAWHVPATHKTAQHGAWVKGPGTDMFDVLFSNLGSLPIIAEDLGVITAEVETLRDRYNFPGMKILQFAFDSDPSNSYLPHNHVKNGVVYTGTHDNDTTRGWCDSLSTDQRRKVSDYLGCADTECVMALIRSALMSVADTAIVPFQDLLGLGSQARMNVPGQAFGNWGWRFTWEMLPDGFSEKIGSMVEIYGRNNKTTL